MSARRFTEPQKLFFLYLFILPFKYLVCSIGIVSHKEIVLPSVKFIASNSSVVELLLKTAADSDQLRFSLLSNNADLKLLKFHSLSGKENLDLTFILTQNSHLIAGGFVKRHFSASGNPVDERDGVAVATLAKCLFTGYAEEQLASASINVCHGVDGVVEIKDTVYYLRSKVIESNLTHYLEEEAELGADQETLRCGSSDDSVHHRPKRLLRGPAEQTPKTRFIELYVVLDNALFRRAGSVDAAVSRAINIVNYASGLYRQLNIYLALVGIEVWNDANKITLASNISANDVLTDFLNYRRTNINPFVLNDNAQLLVGIKFADSTIGKGSTTGMCSHQWSGAVNQDHKVNDWKAVATTMAHEMGHNMGLPHDDSDEFKGMDCSCPPGPSGRCVMFSVQLTIQPTKFSQCSATMLDEEFTEYHTDYCLLNIPESLRTNYSTPVCGNFFVEEGEECDCGMPGDCSSLCCDPATCKLMQTATCATGACCDTAACKLRPIAYPCRPERDQCGLPEFCDGKSEWCPPDIHKLDASPCQSPTGVDAFCYDGKCSSYDSQCLFVWGDNSKSSDSACYQKWNNQSDYYGHCGYEVVSKDLDPTFKYRTCKTTEDLMCGLLQCDTPADKPALKLKEFVRYFNTAIKSNKRYSCKITSLDVGRGEKDPGMVPDGAKCAANKMCINQTCVPVPELPAKCGCNGRGKCNQMRNCHCDIGWAPPFCDEPGAGGSLESGPASIYIKDNRLLIGLLVCFLGIVPIIIVITTIAFCKRHNLKRLYLRIKGRYIKAPTAPSQGSKSVETTKRTQTSAKKHTPGGIQISTPVLQSTTNRSPQISKSSALQPIRVAPAPPHNPHLPKETAHKPIVTPAVLTAQFKDTKPATGRIADKVALFNQPNAKEGIPSTNVSDSKKTTAYENVDMQGKPIPLAKPKPPLPKKHPI